MKASYPWGLTEPGLFRCCWRCESWIQLWPKFLPKSSFDMIFKYNQKHLQKQKFLFLNFQIYFCSFSYWELFLQFFRQNAPRIKWILRITGFPIFLNKKNASWKYTFCQFDFYRYVLFLSFLKTVFPTNHCFKRDLKVVAKVTLRCDFHNQSDT